MQFARAADLAEWFEERWNGKFRHGVTKDTLDLLDEFWATPIPRRPYEVFLKLGQRLAARLCTTVSPTAEPLHTAAPHSPLQFGAARRAGSRPRRSRERSNCAGGRLSRTLL